MHNDASDNDASYWREFEKNQVTHSAAHYLMAISRLRGELGYARVTDVAARLGVSRGAVSIALTHLRKRDWVAEDPNRFLLLTEAGQRVAKRVERNYEILARFFEEVLGVSQQVAHADACKMEHLLSLETGRRLVRLMERVLNDSQKAVQLRDAAQVKRSNGGGSIARKESGRG